MAARGNAFSRANAIPEYQRHRGLHLEARESTGVNYALVTAKMIREVEKLLRDMRGRVDRPATLVGSSRDESSGGDSDWDSNTLFPSIGLVDIVHMSIEHGEVFLFPFVEHSNSLKVM